MAQSGTVGGGSAANGEQAKFVTGDLRRHVAVMSLAGSVGLMGVFLVDLADLFFISLLGQTELAAAVGYAASILFFTLSIGIGLGIAVGALVSRSCGAGDMDRARLWAGNALAAAIAVAVVIGLSVAAAADPLVALLGAEGETARLAARFLSIVAPSMPFTVTMMCAGAILRAYGDARRSMTVTIATAAVNGALDPLLIFGLGLGLDGAALATVTARGAGAAYGIWAVMRWHGGFAPLRREVLLPDLRPIFALALPAMLTNVATPIGAAFLTRLIAGFGDDAVAGYAIVMRLTPVAFGFVFALSGAIGPIVGQNFGARRLDRVRETLRESLKIVGAFVLLASLLLFLCAGLIAEAFGAHGEAERLIFWFCGPLSLFFFFNGALFATNAAFNNLGRPLLAAQFNWARHSIGVIPTALAGAALFGAPGALLGQAVGGVLFAGLAVWRAFRLIDQVEAGAAPATGEPAVAFWRRPNWPTSSPRDS